MLPGGLAAQHSPRPWAALPPWEAEGSIPFPTLSLSLSVPSAWNAAAFVGWLMHGRCEEGLSDYQLWGDQQRVPQDPGYSGIFLYFRAWKVTLKSVNKA